MGNILIEKNNYEISKEEIGKTDNTSKVTINPMTIFTFFCGKRKREKKNITYTRIGNLLIQSMNTINH